jgi:GH43 family beta-xylosidase
MTATIHLATTLARPLPWRASWLSHACLLLGFLLAGLLCADTFRNPLLPRGQDPSVVVHRGEWFLLQSAGALALRAATNLAGLATAPKLTVWPKQCCNVWAPELTRLRERWWIHYAKDDGRNENHRMFALESVGDDPHGPYVDRGKVFDPANDRWAIDGAPFEFRGRLYFVWSGWPGATNGQQNLYLAPMTDPATLNGPRVLLSEPTEAWERIGLPLQEGPQPTVHDGRLFIVYSASGSWTDDYCLGLLEFTGDDVLNPRHWRKHPRPVFAKANGTFGPGHHSMVRAPDDRWWNIYHAIDESGGGWRKRSVRAQPFSWSDAGLPVFGEPLAPGSKVEGL